MKQKIRIIHTVPSIEIKAAGPTYSIVRTCQILREFYANIQLVVVGAHNDVMPLDFLKTFPPGLGPAKLGRSPAMKRYLSTQAQSHEIDILHTHSLWMMPSVYPGWVAKKNNIPLIVSPHGALSAWALNSGSSIKRYFWPLIQKPAIQHAACFHATAYSEYEDIRRLGFKQPIAIIPHGIDLPALPVQIGTIKNKRILLYLARIHPIKGVDLLLQAWKHIENQFPEWALHIAGPDNIGYLAKMQELAQTLSMKNITFLGPLYGEQKWKAYQQADIYVLPTHSENFGVTVAEALASATPVIVTQGAPWKGLIHHNAGWWIEQGVEPLTECLKTALNCSRETLSAMGARGRHWMESDFNWQTLGQQFLTMYEWVLRGGEKPAWILCD